MNAYSEKKTGKYGDITEENALRIYAGANNSLTQVVLEKYLELDNNLIGRDSDIRAASYRYTKHSDAGFTYKIPFNPKNKAYLTLYIAGNFSLCVNGSKFVCIDNISKDCSDQKTVYCYPLKLTDFETGYITLHFSCPCEDMITKLYFLEIAKEPFYTQTIKKMLWDVEDVIYSLGFYDGTANEFTGTSTQFTLPIAENYVKKSNSYKISFELNKKPEKKYVLLCAFVSDRCTDSIDIDCTGSNDYSKNINNQAMSYVKKDYYPMERVVDIDISNLCDGVHSVKINTTDKDGFIDFFAICEMGDNAVDNSRLQIQFKGNKSASDYTKLVNTSMHFFNSTMLEPTSGIVVCSPYNGMFPWLYWVSDTNAAAMVLGRWGFFDYAKNALCARRLKEHAKGDVASAASLSTTAMYLMSLDNYTGALCDYFYQDIKELYDFYSDMIKTEPLHLVRGNNIETSGCQYAVPTNHIIYFCLRMASDVAKHLDYEEDSRRWLQASEILKDSINNHLIFKEDCGEYKKDTWKYAVKSDGSLSTLIKSGWFAPASAENLFCGLRGDHEEFEYWHKISMNTLELHSEKFWPGWKTYGYNRGISTCYGVLGERGGIVPSAMLMLGRLDMVKKNAEHITWCSVDLNFAHGNEDAGELSPWAFVRDTSRDDNGMAYPEDIGNTNMGEDLNLVEFCRALDFTRQMCGVDDSLYKNSNLSIIPRIIQNWEGVVINEWPVRCFLDNFVISTALLSYDYTVAPDFASINIKTSKELKNVQVRFGPFKLNSSVKNVTVDDLPCKYTTQIQGDYLWVWIRMNTQSSYSKAVVTMDVPNLVYHNNFNSCLTKTMQLTANDCLTIFENNMELESVLLDVCLKSKGKLTLKFGKNTFVFDVSDNVISLNNTSVELNLFENRFYTVELKIQDSLIYAYLNSVVLLQSEALDNNKTILASCNCNYEIDNISVYKK